MPKKTADAAPEAPLVSDIIKLLPQRYVEHFPVADLADHPKNPKEHDLGAIIESIRANGWYGTINAQQWKNEPHYILTGHGRRDALEAAGVTHVPVMLIECSPRVALRIVLSDNRTSQLGGFNDNILLQTLSELHASGDLEGTGYTPVDIEELRMITQPIDFAPTHGEYSSAIPYKEREAIIVHVTDITKTPEVRATIGALLAEHPDWTAKIFSSE